MDGQQTCWIMTLMLLLLLNLSHSVQLCPPIITFCTLEGRANEVPEQHQYFLTLSSARRSHQASARAFNQSLPVLS